MRTVVQPSIVFLVLLAVVVFAGCSDPYAGRMEVGGTVKLENEPLKDGQIKFVLMEKQEGGTSESGAPIQNGEFKIERKKGLKPGKYRVEITSGDGKTPTEAEAAGPGNTNIVSVDRVPEDWNTKSKQTAEVTSSGSNKFNFEIPKMNPRAKKR
jgi:hypothetical protein